MRMLEAFQRSPSVHRLMASDEGLAAVAVQRTFPGAVITATHRMPTDGNYAVVQFYAPRMKYGQHATIVVELDGGRMCWGHYFDEGFAANVDFLYRVGRGY